MCHASVDGLFGFPHVKVRALLCGLNRMPLPTLGRSDQNLVLLSSSNKPVVQQQTVTVRTVRMWSPDAMEVLRGTMETSDLKALYEPHGEDNTIPTNVVLCYPNNKP